MFELDKNTYREIVRSDAVGLQVCFETHQTTVDNEAGIATGWLPGRLSELGRRQAVQLGERRRHDGLDAVFSSDLHRAVETVNLAFVDAGPPILLDWRLRECDYGELNGAARDRVLVDRSSHSVRPYPGGESWQHAVDRVGSFLADLLPRWDGARVLIVGHVATRIGLDCHLKGIPLADALETEFVWQPGWEYVLCTTRDSPGATSASAAEGHVGARRVSLGAFDATKPTE